MAPNETSTAAEPILRPHGPLQLLSPKTPPLSGRWIKGPASEGWDDYALSEWELRCAGIADHHPHDEVTVVLEGEIHIRVNDTTVVGVTGDTITVPAGSTGYYWAPNYARMLGVYGPNPHGEDSEYLDYWEIDERD